MKSACVVMLHVACLALLNFSTSSQKGIEYETYVLNFLYKFVWKNSHSKNNLRDMINNTYWSPSEVPLFWSDFNYTWTFDIFSDDVQISKLHENPSSRSWVVPCSKTDRCESDSRFSQSCKLASFLFDLTLFIICHFQTCKFKTILKYTGGGEGGG